MTLYWEHSQTIRPTRCWQVTETTTWWCGHTNLFPHAILHTSGCLYGIPVRTLCGWCVLVPVSLWCFQKRPKNHMSQCLSALLNDLMGRIKHTQANNDPPTNLFSYSFTVYQRVYTILLTRTHPKRDMCTHSPTDGGNKLSAACVCLWGCVVQWWHINDRTHDSSTHRSHRTKHTASF